MSNETTALRIISDFMLDDEGIDRQRADAYAEDLLKRFKDAGLSLVASAVSADDWRPLELSDKEIAAVEESLGRHVSEVEIQNAVFNYRNNKSLEEMRKLLKSWWNKFNKAGGRGVEFADEIDELRIAIAVRSAT